ncbi:MAG: TonB-dependent receptor plug domain-containing protein [Porticoccaceae bacterium]
MEYYRTKACLIAVMLCGFSGYTFSEGIITEEDLLAEIDYVSGVTHLKQDLEQAPAAVTIIDRRTIESSTAVDLVDLFRLVPGFQVYSVHANRTGVTYHAPGGEYSRRLEVKIDGRSVYESFFSSVEWNTLGVDLDDIEYIEVVRGSNAPADGK